MPAKSPRRLPTLTIAPSAIAVRSEFILSPETPDEYHTPLSSTSNGVSIAGLLENDEGIAQDLAILEKLRRNVHMNLQLRPLTLSDEQAHTSSDSPSVYSPSPVSSPYISIFPESLARRLDGPRQPLLLDTRNGGSYLASRIIGSVNIAIPSLILKRHRKPGANFPSIHALRPYITTERGKDIWDDILSPAGVWDGDVVLYDEEMDPREKDSSTAWILLALLDPILRSSGGTAMYLYGGITAFRLLPNSHLRVVSGERDLSSSTSPSPVSNAPPTKRGLSNLNVIEAQNHKPNLPDIEQPSTSPPLLNSPTPNSRTMNSDTLRPAYLKDLSPSPPPSALLHRASQPNIYQSAPQTSVQPRKPSVPNLRRLDTTSADRLPKLTLRTQPPIPVPARATTLAIPSASSGSSRLQPPRTPPHLTLHHDSPMTEDNETFYTPATAFFSSSPGPSTPRPHSPMTARPPLTTPTSEIPSFSISCILPNFLYLGPELTTPENVAELQSLGVKRILNLAAECDPDDHGLDLRGHFEKYVKIAMRDTVEEENIGRGVREVCECLDDARLHSSPTYVHCKAGKSRSVTAVMAYLIHANHWTLSKAYAFVLERRKGISPNIGFVSELMNFEEQELGGKSIGVVSKSQSSSHNGGAGGDAHDEASDNARAPNYSHVAGIRRPAHMRESLPPVFVSSNSESGVIPGGAGITGDEVARVGDHAQELEVKDREGRYRHQRRAPVDENTLQPLRRVSKAGLESGGWT